MLKKTHFGHDLGPFRPNFGPPFFFKNMVSSFARYHDQLPSYTTSGKTNYPILRKVSDGRADGQTDVHTRVIS